MDLIKYLELIQVEVRNRTGQVSVQTMNWLAVISTQLCLVQSSQWLIKFIHSKILQDFGNAKRRHLARSFSIARLQNNIS